MLPRIIQYLFLSFPFAFTYNMSHLLRNVTFAPSKSVVNLTYSLPTTAMEISTSFSYNFTSSLSILGQNIITSTSPVPLYVMKETLRKGDDKLTENSPEIYCKFQPNGFDCDESGIFTPKFYYDVKMETCKTFYFGQCKLDQNRFDSLPDCHDTCLEPGKQEMSGQFSANVYCKLQPEFGKCNDYYPMWYYDMSTRDCRGFSYSGCGGNLNRFVTHQLCIALCNHLRD